VVGSLRAVRPDDAVWGQAVPDPGGAPASAVVRARRGQAPVELGRMAGYGASGIGADERVVAWPHVEGGFAFVE
jgi:hypothetical protein